MRTAAATERSFRDGGKGFPHAVPRCIIRVVDTW